MTAIIVILSIVNIFLFAIIFSLKEKFRKIETTIERHEKDLGTLILHTRALTDAVNTITKEMSERQEADIDTFMNWYMIPKTNA